MAAEALDNVFKVLLIGDAGVGKSRYEIVLFVCYIRYLPLIYIFVLFFLALKTSSLVSCCNSPMDISMTTYKVPLVSTSR